MDIQSIILHEFGHWLFLDDEYDFWCSENVMFYYVDYEELKRDLTQDDKDGIIHIYGQNPSTPIVINPFHNRQHVFFEYEPTRFLFYNEISDSKNIEKINQTPCPCSRKNKSK